MRQARAFAWIMVFAFFTSVSDPEFLLKGEWPSFRWVAAPDYLTFFSGTLYMDRPVWIAHKIAHFMSFAILAYLLRKEPQWNGKRLLLLALFVGVLTELLQLHLDRTGRLYDVGIDLAGTFAAMCMFRRGR